MNKKIFRVKLKYFSHEIGDKLPIPCMEKEYGEFFFNWSLETAKQFMKHLMSMQPMKFYISSVAEIEAVSSKLDLFQKIIDSFNKLGNKKIDKFELISIIPFMVEDNLDTVLMSSMAHFCLENENLDIITKNELGLFIDSLFRGVHNILVLDNGDDLYMKTKNHILKLSENEIDELLTQVFKKEEDELALNDVISRFPKEFKDILQTINQGIYQSLKYFEKKIIQDNMS